MPPAPTLTLGLPLATRLPPLAVPAAALLPAFRTRAEALVLLVATLAASVRSPLRVAMLTVPLADTPEVPPAVPMVSVSLSL